MDSYGYMMATDELVRQAQKRGSVGVLADVLCTAEDDPHAKDLALKSLHSDDENLREVATNWCAANPKLLSQDEKKSLMKLVLDRFKASKGHEGWSIINEIGTSDDLPVIRSVYDVSYRKQVDELDGATSLYSCAHALLRPFPTRSAFVLLLARLGDVDAKREIVDALKQSKDAERHCWGVIMAAKLQWQQTIPLIARGLDDHTMLPEMVDQLPDDQNRRFVWQECYTRVCDVSLRAIAELAPPTKKWDFKVTPASEWAYMGGSSGSLAYHEYVDTVWNPDKQLYLIRNIVGFTPEQIGVARAYAASLDKPAHK
jgi:hypothetical protein